MEFIKDNDKQPNIGALIDNTVNNIEKINANLKEILPKNYANTSLDRSALGELVILIGNIFVKKQSQ